MKRGSILDLAFVVIILFGIYLTIPIMSQMMTELATGTARTPLNTTRFSENMTALKNTVDTTIDASFVIITFALILTVSMASAIVFSSPIFFMIGLFVLLIVIIFSMGISNASETIASSGAINYTAYPMSQLIMGNLPIILSIVGFALIVIYFAKRRQMRDTYDV